MVFGHLLIDRLVVLFPPASTISLRSFIGKASCLEQPRGAVGLSAFSDHAALPAKPSIARARDKERAGLRTSANRLISPSRTPSQVALRPVQQAPDTSSSATPSGTTIGLTRRRCAGSDRCNWKMTLLQQRGKVGDNPIHFRLDHLEE